MLPSVDVDGALHVSKPYPSYTTAWARPADVAAPPPGAAVPTTVATMAMATEPAAHGESDDRHLSMLGFATRTEHPARAQAHHLGRRREGLHG